MSHQPFLLHPFFSSTINHPSKCPSLPRYSKFRSWKSQNLTFESSPKPTTTSRLAAPYELVTPASSRLHGNLGLDLVGEKCDQNELRVKSLFHTFEGHTSPQSIPPLLHVTGFILHPLPVQTKHETCNLFPLKDSPASPRCVLLPRWPIVKWPPLLRIGVSTLHPWR